MAYRFVLKISSLLFLIAGLAILAYTTWQKDYKITAFLVIFTLLGCIGMVLSMIHKSIRNFYELFTSIEMDDFSQNFRFQNTLPIHLQKSLQDVFQKFQKIRLEKEAQYLYLQSVIQHIPVGIFSVCPESKVDFYNTKLLSILRCSPFKKLDDLPECYASLITIIQQEKATKQLVRLLVEEEVLELVITVSKIQISGKNYTIVALQDFQAELEEKEMDAWQNLTRILTHEIINSVTPIVSLASTISENLKESPDDIEDSKQAIEVIEKRSKNLIHFVQEFRAFTKLPTPKPQNIILKEVFERLHTLISKELEEKNIHFICKIHPEGLLLYTDLMMLEQILINLLKNAIQAVLPKDDRCIVMDAHTDHLGKVIIRVQDNGVGISDDAKKSIFIPFFTTKKTGSGIGLSLSRQMMRVQGGTISVHSVLSEGSTFTLRFS
ncbi:MAG: HAMP domain-containing histidine kinase [Raineya sp.]|jgi:signal transduction histidine kinase|nr:HAMP domain-containing histidine kinase [Raineya sp.]